MQRFSYFTLLLWFLAGSVYSQEVTDPCNMELKDLQFPDVHRRDAAYELSDGEDPINDRGITEGWYGNPRFKLSDTAPGFFKCGSWFTIWKQSSDAGQLTMCIQSRTEDCAMTFGIEMRQCGGFEVYYLIRALANNAAYCLESDPNAIPAYDETPSITFGLEEEPEASKLFFRCNVKRSSENLFYRTIWFVNGAPLYTFEPQEWIDDSFDYIGSTQLTEELLAENNVTKAGFNLQCAVRAQYGADGLPSKSKLSANQFVGIKVDIRDYGSVTGQIFSMNEGDTRQFSVNVTVPFGCGTRYQQGCNMHVEFGTLDATDTCSSSLLVGGLCGIDPIETWGQPSSVSVVGSMTSLYEKNNIITRLFLKTQTSALSLLSPLWHDYSIGHVTFQIVKDNTIIKGKYCMADNDPYIHTFDHDNTDHYLGVAGVYTLYQDTQNHIEVQIQTQSCSWNGGFCTCGMVVRARKSVFEVSKCNVRAWVTDFRNCDTSDAITVRQNWNQYIIQLYTGNVVDVYLWPSGMELLNVFVYPTVLDEKQSRGMCGYLSDTPDDDLVKKDGLTTESRDEFHNSWKIIEDENNLFLHTTKERQIQMEDPVYQYCTCSTNSQFECSPRRSEDCVDVNHFDKVTAKACTITRRKKRMALMYPERVKRQVTPEQTWFNGWNESSATEYCDLQFNKSNMVQTVKDVPGVNVDTMKKDCVQDIKHSGTTDFTSMAIAMVRVLALHEAMVNPALSLPDPSNPSAATKFDQITLQTCVGDCSERGSCIQGICQCNAGYGGGDCSVDLTTPPVVYDAGDEGHCDLAGGDCTALSVIGQIFSGEKDSRCRIEKSMINNSGQSEKNHVNTSAAVSESISEVECTLPEAAADDIVLSYNISVSHAGDIYSNEITVLVYDSSCVNVNHDTRAWTIKDGYCIYKGKCVGIGGYRQDDPCRRCDHENGAPSWVKENDCPGGSPTDGNDASNPTTHPSMAFIIITAAVVLQ